jgi:hypothetical protein
MINRCNKIQSVNYITNLGGSATISRINEGNFAAYEIE